MDLLARREHSRFELAQKLRQRFSDQDGESMTTTLSGVLDQLERDDLLSDQRFVESYVRVRSEKGYGPLHIRQHLQQAQVASELIDTWIDDRATEWQQQLALVISKRCGSAVPPDGSREYLRLLRFLHARGFTGEQIRCALKDR